MVSQDVRGRALDNIFVERLWRSVKYEEVYPKVYTSVQEALNGLEKYFHFYRTHLEDVCQVLKEIDRQSQVLTASWWSVEIDRYKKLFRGCLKSQN